MHAYRTHHCNALSIGNVGETVKLSGWVHRRRDHGGLMFIDLRDHYGITQIVLQPESDAFKTVERVRSESVICITGNVTARPDETINKNLDTGMIEITADTASILSAADELPMPPTTTGIIDPDASTSSSKPKPWSSRSSPSGTFVRDPVTGEMRNIDA